MQANNTVNKRHMLIKEFPFLKDVNWLSEVNNDQQ